MYCIDTNGNIQQGTRLINKSENHKPRIYGTTSSGSGYYGIVWIVIHVNVLQIPLLFWYFLFDLTECYCWYQHSDSYTGKCMSVWRDIVTLNTIKIITSDIHYHCEIGLAAILRIMSVPTFKNVVILYIPVNDQLVWNSFSDQSIVLTYRLI